MVVGYEQPSAPANESMFSRLSNGGGSSIIDRILRTPIHREVAVLVAAGAIVLIGAALVLAQRSGEGTAYGEISSDAIEGGDGRSNGDFSADGDEAVVGVLEVVTDESSVGPEPAEATSAVTQPDPPVTDPPVTDPPVTDPPVTDPPVTDPPPTDPPPPDPPPGAGEPYRNHVLPRKIQAEHFDADGAGLAYNDADVENLGGVSRRFQQVDVYETTAGAVYVRRTETGEWLEYTVTVPDAGNYIFEVSVSSANADPGGLLVQVDGQRTASFDVPSTGSNGDWVQLQSRVKNIDAGIHVIRLEIVGGGKFGIDWFAVRAA